jgi:BMFP domain-containing protein YqiC
VVRLEKVVRIDVFSGAKLAGPHIVSIANQMADPRLVDQIGARISEVLANSPARDVEKNMRALLASFFDRFDLVTREDFEAQKRVLERTRARITELERRVQELEAGRTGGPSP